MPKRKLTREQRRLLLDLAGVVQEAETWQTERDRLIEGAQRLGIPDRQIAKAARMGHTTVWEKRTKGTD